jgi:O-antigen/teichoic acid export membrane protein
VYPFVPAFVLMYVIQASGTALGRGIDIARKTHWSLVVPLVSVLTGLSALSLLVPAWGVWGAVVAGLITTTVRTLVHVALAFHFYPRPLHGRSLSVVAAVSLLGFLVGSSAETGLTALDVSLKLVAVGGAAAAIFWFALDRKEGLALLGRMRSGR